MLHIFYFQIFALDSAVIKTYKLFSSKPNRMEDQYNHKGVTLETSYKERCVTKISFLFSQPKHMFLVSQKNKVNETVLWAPKTNVKTYG